jgi:hypothetical protein
MLSKTNSEMKLKILIDMKNYFESLTDEELISLMGGELLPEFIDKLTLKEIMCLFYSIREKTP